MLHFCLYGPVGKWKNSDPGRFNLLLINMLKITIYLKMPFSDRPIIETIGYNSFWGLPSYFAG